MTIINHSEGHRPHVGAIKRREYCPLCGFERTKEGKCMCGVVKPKAPPKTTRLECPCCGVRLVLTEDK
jgi:hypothetical protein